MISNKAARTIHDWPAGTRFRVNNVLYTKVDATGMIDEFRVLTFRNGKNREVRLTVYTSDTVTFVDYGRKP